jgi:chitodextrinase
MSKRQPVTLRGTTHEYAQLALVAVVALVAALTASVGTKASGSTVSGSTAAGSTAAESALSAAAGDPVLAAGGDIACRPGKTVDLTHCGQGKSGAVVTGINPNYVIPLGDSQYDSGTPAEYAGSYDATGWGTTKGISRPAAGNHEYRTTGATGYYGYFGTNAGDPQKGYYSWDVPVPSGGSWHMIALNSECDVLGGGSISAGCGVGSSQEAWLKADLAAHPNVCTIAYWHRPRFSSSTTTPSSTTYKAFWNDLYAAGADVVLNGHAHDYERFTPQTSAGVADPKGLAEFVVGTGGDGFQTMGPAIANSVVRDASAFGVLKMTLHSNSYDFQFVPAAGYALSDSGTNIPCHSAPVADTTKPSAPTNVTATASSANQVDLRWTAATDNVGVTNYNIYRGSNGATPTLLTTTTTNATTFTDTTVTASTSYTYQVYAQDAAGNVGPASGTASVSTPASADTTPPTAPSGLAAEEVFSNEIDLGWTGSSDSGTGVSGYKVYRQGPGESTFTLLATQPGTGAGHNSYVDLTVKPSSAYQYYVTAYDGANLESPQSNTVSSSTPAGPTSKTFTFTTSGDATIQQATPAINNGSAASLRVGNSPVEDVMMKFDVATNGCESLTSAKLTVANNADGSAQGGDFYTTGPNWAEGTVSWDNAPTRGSLLNSLGAVASDATATVDVTPGVSSLNGEVDFRIGSTSSDPASYFSKEGTGPKPTLTVVCATSAAVPDNTPPSAPTGLTGAAKNSGEVDLSWTASTDNIGVTNYDVYRGGTLVGTVPGGSSQGSALTYQDITVAPSTSYDYTVKARDAADNASAASNTATVTTPGAGGGGGSITAGAAKTTQVTTAGTSWTVNLPTYTAGDFMVIWLGNNLGSTAGTPTASGWVAQLATNESAGLKGTFLTRRMVAGDPSTVTVTWSLGTLGVAEATAFTGVDTATPVDVKAGQAEASTTAVASHSTPSKTTTAAGDVLVTGFTTDKTATWTSSDPELADAGAGGVSAAMYASAPVPVGSYARSATASVASVKAVSSLLALKGS